jgi:uncharacterized coiled-coil protein SlyX
LFSQRKATTKPLFQIYVNLQILTSVALNVDMEYDIDLEQELQLELAKLDQIFLSSLEENRNEVIKDEIQNQPTTPIYSSSLARSSLGKFQGPNPTAFDLAEAEIEKEELQDKLRLLLTKTEDFDTQLMTLHAENQDLYTRYMLVIRENERLKQELNDVKNFNLDNQSSPPGVESGAQDGQNFRSEQEFQELEFKLAETRSKLARYQQNVEDLTLARDYTLKELDRERMTRIHIEKERDAYSAAYEASLEHLNKWAKAKVIPPKKGLMLSLK